MMCKTRLHYFLTTVSFVMMTLPCWATETITFTVTEGSVKTQYTITFHKVAEDIWTYYAYRSGKKRLGSLSLKIGSCFVKEELSRPVPAGSDPGIITWETDVSNNQSDPSTFKFKLDNEYPQTTITVTIEVDGISQQGEIIGPDCTDPINPTDDRTCAGIISQDAPMGLIDKLEWDGEKYDYEKGSMQYITVSSDEERSTNIQWEVKKSVSVLIQVDTIIVQGTGISNSKAFSKEISFKPGAKTAGIISISSSPSQLPSGIVGSTVLTYIDSIQFCEDSVLDTGKEVCLWSADKDKEGNYTNIKQENCMTAKKDKFYAIDIDGQFSNAIQAD